MPFAKPVANAFSTLASAYVAGAGTLVVADGSKFGTLTGSEFLRVSVWAPNAVTGVPALVHLKITARSGNNLTVAGPMDGDTDVSLAAGSIVGAVISVGTLKEIHDQFNAMATFVGYAPPAVTSSLAAAGTNGVSFSYTITGSNSPSSFGATSLPAGLTRTGAVISGTPSASGTFSVPITVTNASGSETKTLVITIA